jgi:hypothetical protein
MRMDGDICLLAHHVSDYSCFILFQHIFASPTPAPGNGALSPLLCCFAIASECNRVGAAHRVRSVFERAVGSNGGLMSGGGSGGMNSARSMVALWRLFV